MSSRWQSVTLWLLAFVVTVSLAVFQRLTGPTHPLRTTVTLGQQDVPVKLRRSHPGEGGLPVSVKSADAALEGTVQWRRYPTQDPWQELAMVHDGQALVAEIPHQPPAGKVEYRVVLERGEHRASVPDGEPVVARFRGSVSPLVLIPHILAMFGSMLVSTRALFEVLRSGDRRGRGLILTAMVLLLLGGGLLGPMVQKQAFGAFWTGWPLGQDLTDNKTALAVAAWLPATILALARRRTRWATVVGWLVMMAVFLIPHSMRGSEIDWSKHEGPASPTRTGDP